MADVKLSQLAAVSPASVAAGAALWTFPGHIDGLKLEWLAANQLRVTTGSAYIQSLGYAINVAAAITKTGMTLTANTWYHVYLYMNGATPDIEFVTTAPAAAYNGTARSKTGDTTRRYLGSVKCGASANSMMKFSQSGERVQWYDDTGVAPFRVLSLGVATTLTAVAAAAVVPVTSRMAQLKLTNSCPDVPARFTNSDAGQTPPANLVSLPAGTNNYAFLDFPLNSSQELQYFMNGTPVSGGAYIDVLGYVFER